MENLNAEAVKKALELCANEWYCGLCEFTEKECALIKKNALALINSQEQRIKELTEEVERLGAEKEHLDLVVEGKLKRTTALEKQVLKLTEENERLVTALANYDRQTEVRIAEEYYTAEAYEELREENERLHASCTEFERKCASLNDEVERLRASSIDYRNIPDIIAEAKADTVKQFAERLIAEFRKDGRMNYYLRKTLDQIAKEIIETK